MVGITASRTVAAVVKKDDEPRCRFRVELPEPVQAPLKNGQRVGMASLYLADKRLADAPLLANADVALSWPLTIWLWFKRGVAGLLVLFLLALGVRTCVIAVRNVRRRGRPSPPSYTGRRRGE